MAIMNDIAQDAARAWDIIAGPFIRPGTTPTNRQLFNYQIGNIEVEPGNLNFSVVPELDFSVSQDLFNNTSVQQSQTASFNESRTETTSTAVTHGVKSGVTVSASAKFNAKILVKSIEQTITTTVSTEYNFSSTTTRTNTVTRGWSIAQPVLVPPHSRVTATLQIYKGDFTVPVLLSLRVYGQTGTLAGNPSFPSLYAATYENTLLGRIREHIAPPALFRASNAYISNGVQAIWRGTATTRVSQGLYSVVRIDERPLAGYSGETRTYYLPVTLSNSSQILTPGSLGSEIPIINPVPNASCKKENSPIIIHHDREKHRERDYDKEHICHDQAEKYERDYDKE